MNQSYDVVETALRLRAGLAEHLGAAGPDVDEPLVDHVGGALPPALLVDVVRACGGMHATRVDVLGCATLRELAAWIERTGGAAREPRAAPDAAPNGARPEAPLAPEDADDAPASPAQEDLWLAAQVQEEGAAYHLSIALRFDAPVDDASMRRALVEMIARHPSLRTTFRRDAQGLRQCVRAAAQAEVDWSEAVLPAPDEAGERESGLRDALTRFAQSRFDLHAGPLLRARLHRGAPDCDVVQIVVHHIVFDAWSRMVVSREIVDAYHALRAGRAIAWSAAAASPGAFARGQRDALTPQRVARLREYWRAQLAGVPPVLDLPTDFARPAVRDGIGATALRMLPAALAERLAAVGARHGASLFMTLMAAWQILLWRCSRQHEFAIGTPMAARDAGAFESTVGYLVNTVVLRASVRADEPFGGLLARVAQTVLDAHEHKALPLREVIELAGADRNPSHTPLFQAMFEFHNERPGVEAAQAAPVRAVPHDVGAAKYDLSLEIAYRHDGLACTIEYATALFARSSIDGLLAQYEALLEQIAAMPDAPVGSLSCLPDGERERVTRTWNATAFERTGSPLIHARFDARVRACPAAIALRTDAATMTFAALGERVDALAGRLLERTGGEPERIAICLERSFDMVSAILATLKAGCAYVPIDPQLPADRVAFMLSDSAAALLLTIEPIRRERLASFDIDTLCLDAPAPPRAAPPRAAPAVDPHAAAYVLYTSGSTGKPKGVAVTHANVTNLLDVMEASYPVGAHDRYLLKTNYAFDVSVPELFGWFVGDGSLAILAPQAEGSPDLIVEALLRHGVTHLNFTPSLLRQFVTEAAADARFARGHRLRHVFVVGEELTSALANDAWHALRPAAIYNMYGPTETTVFATGYAHTAPIPNGRVPIGRALGNMRVYVLDERMRPMPIGMPGDLYIAGDGVARGYLNRDELTAERFLPDPFTPGGRIYMTGDLARWTRDGMLEFLGRTDQQVKIRGYRVELDEIASALNAHPLVGEAAVILKREPDGDARLVAYVVPAEGAAAAPSGDERARLRDALVGALEQRLPDYMVPADYAFAHALPKGITGKLDRKALEALPVERPARDAALGAVAPRNDTQRALCAIWQAVLRVPALGVTDNFFAVGGDSILSIQAAARAREQGIVFSARDIFRHQTVELLAAHVRWQQAPDEARRASAGDMPLLPIHHWFFEVDSTHVDHYHQSRLLDVPAGVDAAFVRAWLAALVARHDALRLRLRDTPAGWRAHFAEAPHADASARLMVCDVAWAGAPDAALDAFFADARRGVRLADGPLFVAALVAAGATGRGRLLLIGHHAVVDGVSWRVIVADLRRTFAQWPALRPDAPGPASDAYQAWARALVAAADSPALHAERAHWLRVLRAPAPALRLDRAAGGDATRRATRIGAVSLNAADTRALLADTHRAYRTQTIELLLAGLLLAFRRWQGHDALRIALEGHGREADALAHYGAERGLPDVGETVGWFTSYYPQWLTLAGAASAPAPAPAADSVAAAIMAVKTQYRATPRHGIGYGILRYVAGDPELAAEAAAHAPEIVFNYLGQFDVANDETAGIAVLDLSSRDDIAAARPREHALGIDGGVKDGCLAFEIDYSGAAFDDESIAAFGAHFMHALREIAAHCKACAAWRPTPEDFPLAAVTQAELDVWHARHPSLETLYPATAIQRGMVFHSLLPKQASAYTNQVHARVGGGTFDAARLRHAWQTVLERHAALRTAFVGFEREQPLQIVLAHAACPWRDIDHRHLAPEARDAAFAALLAADKAAPFDFGRAPLMRFHLVRDDDAHYRFIWTYHHAVLDGWSVQLVWSDLLRVYEALAAGRPAALPAAVQFDAVLAWRQRHASDADKRYWREQIGARTQRTVLDIEQAGLAAASPAAPAVVERSLDEAASERLATAARACRVTLASVLQAAWALLLARHSGETAPVFGVTSSGRAIDVPGVETIVGPLIATVPARVDVDAALPLGDWLRAVHERHVEREAHAQLELVDILRESGVRGGQPLFDSLLVVENYPLAEPSAARILGLRDYGYAEDTHYGLTVSATPGPRLRVEINFDRSRYHIEDIEAMADNLKAVLTRVPDDLARPAGDVLGGADAARAQAGAEGEPRLSRVSRQGELRLGRHLVPHLVEDHAAATPERRALVYNERAYSYGELNRAANRIANRLMQAFPDLGTDALVGVRVSRSDRLVLTVLAIWKIGAAYIPIDPVLPGQRMREMLELAGAKALVVDAAVAAAEPAVAGVPRIAFDDLVQDDPCLEDNPDVHLSGNDLSYVLFTSGSTGKPKGAMIEHIGMLNNIANKALDLEMDEDSRVAQNASMSFDVSVWQMFIALTKGGTTFVYDERAVNDIAGLIRRMAADGVTILEVVPTYLIAVVEYLEEHPECVRPASLRFLIVNGETVDATLIRRWFALFPATKLINAYGPTEASDDITHHIMSPGDEIVNPVPVGRALANFDLYVVDDELRPVPIGTRGEIVATGVGIGRGYIGMAGATAQAFVKSPFPDRYKGRLYRTGDLGEMREDGVLMFHGRKDRQVKIRGMRIELDEVEASLRAIAAVRQAVVLAIRPENREAFLCACVVPLDGAREEIVDALKAKLPPYMVPSVFRFERELPQLPSGKVDRNRLREQCLNETPRAREHALAPRSPLERRLAEVFGEVLGHDAFGVLDDFFALGGDSFKAIRIAAKYGPPLEVTDIYDHPTIEALAAHLERAPRAERSIVQMAGDPATAKAALVCIANAAGGPVNFVEMSRAMAEQAGELAVFAVKLPRNAVDSDAAMLAEVTRLANAVCDDLLAASGLPIIVFAQCNGSALAIAVARELTRRSADLRALCMGGALMRTASGKRDARTDDEILGFLGGIGSTLPGRPDERAFFLHEFRYDSWLADVYYNHLVDEASRGALTPLDIPVWCLVGTDDPLVSQYETRHRDWLRIGRSVKLAEFAGIGHYLLRDCPHALARTLGQAWEAVSRRSVEA
ncbi:non-ribosomal peptide synthetase [Burkholderia pseudomallei]|uniref:non-ribosomal peptide synthetase n=2 Tax=Burkholderia pseudomallei TaxID=28450 RepID=UPI0007180EA2|nr:non-ribosomal peptide synthetase [Burkholderia pseudomallei]MBF3811532.1 non-ribosomal peptide synthetase [Burkholderia pseudomallei]OMS50596.1 non-ribosomal peptide synthetase [Burkholderia pseudomallei]OMS60233.1 non-ribosomal peptide synthetase [Burkholderia pseudomallei]OMS74505.1 non-ribosomal peptide synthetase [Burkholderia pseudomallei]CAJ3130880.1 siderophore non-ribosomal peptide synthase [Burkholderia pseudomallei]